MQIFYSEPPNVSICSVVIASETPGWRGHRVNLSLKGTAMLCGNVPKGDDYHVSDQ